MTELMAAARFALLRPSQGGRGSAPLPAARVGCLRSPLRATSLICARLGWAQPSGDTEELWSLGATSMSSQRLGSNHVLTILLRLHIKINVICCCSALTRVKKIKTLLSFFFLGVF